ncbi:hypothetical protein SUGI_0094220 [Cryptomeria japonica]|nr:hypothetical protein SUGI_0094220 [Cryptomeria japonica]
MKLSGDLEGCRQCMAGDFDVFGHCAKDGFGFWSSEDILCSDFLMCEESEDRLWPGFLVSEGTLLKMTRFLKGCGYLDEDGQTF